MSRARPATVVLVVAVVAALAGSAPAATFPACTAAEMIARDAACPASGPCSISQVFVIGDGCTIDFGSRPVTILSSGEFRVGGGSVTIRSGAFTVGPGGYVNARGDTPGNNVGGLVSFVTAGSFTIARSGASNGRVDASADLLAGAVSVDATGPITVQGRLVAGNTSGDATGGLITLDSGGDILLVSGATVGATGGARGSGGAITLAASGQIRIEDVVDVRGGDGGLLEVDADLDAVVDRVLASATGSGGTGGSIGVDAGGGVQLLGNLFAHGTSASDGTSGGDGGEVELSALYGDLVVAAQIGAEGAAPDGSGGSLSLGAAGSIVVQPVAPISVRGNGGGGSGGDFTVDGDLDVALGGLVDVSGGQGGGTVDGAARRTVTVSGRLDASGREAGGAGGSILLIAGSEGKGALTVAERLDVRGGGCSVGNGCGVGGVVDLVGCDVTVTTLGEVLARGPGSGGAVSLSARELLRVAGPVWADATSAQGTPGVVALQYPSRRPAIVTPGVIVPLQEVAALATCTGPGQTNCLDPCPTCGNGVVEFPETCDQAGVPAGCDGCSAFCRVESCDDLNRCTSDSCDPILGCRHAGVPDGTACGDGVVCNGVETCVGAVCVPGVPLSCDDGNFCTLDTCVEPGGCAHPPVPAGVPCNDGNACTQNDYCGGGQCVPGVPLICDDDRECTVDACVPTFGCTYTPRTGPCTDDGNPCTDDQCNFGFCRHAFRANGTACDDGRYCTVDDGCFAGVCLGGTARSCDDGNSCTADTCDDLAGVCVASPAATCCGNGVVEAGEECDDGNTNDGDGCLGTCQIGACGDGTVRAGVEECDEGTANSNAPDAACRTDCRPARCGDGIVDPLRGEQCDDGNRTAGDGCSAACFVEPPPTAVFIAGKGSALNDCVLEWKMDRPALDRRGAPDVKQPCRDNDPVCDFDPTPGVCVFHVWACANVSDPRLPLCAPASPALGTPVDVSVTKPSVADTFRRPEDAQNRQALLAGASALQTSPLEMCGPRLALRVPFRKPTRAGRKALKVRAVTSRNSVDSDQLKLVCAP